MAVFSPESNEDWALFKFDGFARAIGIMASGNKPQWPNSSGLLS